MELVGGPLDGTIVPRRRGGEPYVYVEGMVHRVEGGLLVYADDRVTRCPGCGCWHDDFWTDDCSLCGARLKA